MEGNATAKIPALVAGMVVGADSISDMDLLRHGGMDSEDSGPEAFATRPMPRPDS